VRVDDWGRGQLNLRATWRGTWGGRQVEPFVAVQNALDTRYVGAISLNGFAGRVFESAPGRNWYAGLEIGTPILR
jgi:iron complex outermembrane receptor protein